MKKYFNLDKISTLEELKREFKKLALVHHPDRGGNIVEFQNLNNEYEKLYHIYQQKSTRKDEKNENVNTYRDILNQIIKFDKIEIEVVGTWIWVSGKGTFDIIPQLQALKFFYSGKHKCWMYKNGEKKKKVYNKMKKGDIVERYGSTKVDTNPTNPTNKLK